MSIGPSAQIANIHGRRRLHQSIAFLAAFWWTLLAGLSVPLTTVADFTPNVGIAVETTLPVFDRINNQYSVYANLRNDSTETLSGPTRLVVAQSSLAVQNAEGTTAAGEPWFTISASPDFQLAPGARTNRLRIGFAMERTKLTYSFRVETDVPNRPPVANAGADQTARVDAIVNLDASASTDPDGNPLTFDWSFLARAPGSAAALSGRTILNPSFQLDRFGNYDIGLTVSDGRGASATDSVRVSTLNSPPIANAGPDQTARVGTSVELDGSASTDVDRQPLTYRWALAPPNGSTAALDDLQAPRPHFTLDRPDSYLGTLIVNDGIEDSAPDSITVTTENSKPVANAGPDQSVFVGTIVTLDGSASSDVDGDDLSYLWSLTAPSGSAAGLSDAHAVARPSPSICPVPTSASLSSTTATSIATRTPSPSRPRTPGP